MTTAPTGPAEPLGQPRIDSVDQIRALALLLMAVFHFSYNLSVFGLIPFSMQDPFWIGFRFVIVTLFFASVGVSLVLANPDGIRWRAFWVREGRIVAGAVTITGMTAILYPNAWVWFGVLHFIAVASLLALPLLYRPRVALMIGVLIFLLFNLTPWFNLSFLYDRWQAPLHLPHHTMDLTRLIPWLGMVYIGVYLGHRRLFGLARLPMLESQTWLNWLGRHSLGFYLIHQIPLFALAWIIARLVHG
ncbi:MAG: heparan-alpha-glucosaminide N-acetyltransferase [Saccharospirillum sp.]